MNTILTTTIDKPYEIHELANLVPMATDSEQEALTYDVRLNGLRDPIVLWHGKIVDGRCRQKACIVTKTPIRAKELDYDLNYNDVAVVVKSLNTRRNLTLTQKVMSASFDYKNPHIPGSTRKQLATAWGISTVLLSNGIYLVEHQVSVAKDLFNGKTVELDTGKFSSKVSTVYAYYKKREESAKELPDQYGWDANAMLKTQSAKNEYYRMLNEAKAQGDGPLSMYWQGQVIYFLNNIYSK